MFMDGYACDRRGASFFLGFPLKAVLRTPHKGEYFPRE